MHLDDVSGAVDEELLTTTITTNLLGPIRMTSALVDHLSRKTHGAIINTSSVLGFIPLATTAVYSAAKAALHSYTLSLRYKLKHTSPPRDRTRPAVGADGFAGQQSRAARDAA